MPSTVMRRRLNFALLPAFLFSLLVTTADATGTRNQFGVRDDLNFPLHARASNKDGSTPVYKNPDAPIEDRVNDLLPRMTLEEKVAQLYVVVLLCALTPY